jgi:hypothetical protein
MNQVQYAETAGEKHFRGLTKAPFGATLRQ